MGPRRPWKQAPAQLLGALTREQLPGAASCTAGSRAPNAPPSAALHGQVAHAHTKAHAPRATPRAADDQEYEDELTVAKLQVGVEGVGAAAVAMGNHGRPGRNQPGAALPAALRLSHANANASPARRARACPGPPVLCRQVGMFGPVEEFKRELDKLASLMDTEDEGAAQELVQGGRPSHARAAPCRPAPGWVFPLFFPAPNRTRLSTASHRGPPNLTPGPARMRPPPPIPPPYPASPQTW